MSKRQREEASIASLKAILGDLPDDLLTSLLHRANNNVETAINLYFANPEPPQQLLTTSSISHTKSDPRQFTRYFIGDVVVTAWSLVKGNSPVKEGQRVEIVRDKVGGKNAHRIVRFKADGREIGRLPKDTANYISVLLDQQLCQFEGSVVWSPYTLSIGEDVILLIKCYLLPLALNTTSFMSNTIPSSKKKSIVKGSDDTPVVRKVALLQMFKQLGLRPTRSAIQRMNVDSGGTVDLLLQTFLSKDESSSKANEEDGQDEEGEEERKEITDKQLDTIYSKAQIFDAHIKPMDTPTTMSLELKEYQKRALAWMHTKEIGDYDEREANMKAMHPLWEEYELPGEFVDEHRFFYFNPYSGELSLEFPESSTSERGGILADEMGLGKTIEILSLIHTNRFKEFSVGYNRANRFKSPTTLVVCPMSLIAQWRDELLRGSKRDTLSVELYYGDDRKSTLSHLCQWDGGAPDVLITTYGVILSEWTRSQTPIAGKSQLFTIDFWRVVIDEAHHIKNRAAKISQACSEIRSCRRWALTGTPIQNKLDDLYSLVRYLHHEPWANHTFWKTFITIPFEKQDPRALSAVQTVLEPIILRRTKAMRDSAGRPMVPLPPKTINIEYLTFSKEEQDFYDSFYEHSRTQFSYFCEAGKIGQNYASIFQLLTRLRQICCHPYLVLHSNKEFLKEGSSDKLTLQGLIASKNAESQNISSYESGSSYEVKVLQNMLAMQELGSSSTSVQNDGSQPSAPISDECPICFEVVDTMIGTPCMHFACRPCVMDYFQKRENEGAQGECPVCRRPISQAQLLEFTQQKTPEAEEPSNNIENQQFSAISSSTNTSGTIRFEIQKAVGGFKPSSKMNALFKHLRQYNKEGLKTVVFSQFTTFLDLIEQGLKRESINFTRLDGTQTQAQREKVLKNFSMAEDGADVLLISLRAGGVGLNLTCASRIIMMDPWWNFAIESQAIDRVHRLGQSQEVVVTRFIMRDSVEERILAIQDRKHSLTNELYGAKESKNRKLEELQLLFSKNL
ncbi:SNF2 family N-terminal domain-containing protein [Mycotypha africana]|uniref:SNF2 family N-terminal domain-containing protein n=1 Tax=Mycotypha africana TaxID=64632 RepID=UPI00230158A2|nr:SNF2 family N-terminal domain-containing protein [Mycotypha africana]KAI8969028.1 SNF2 family N-terminal domain-containing protein [Mycotypha africana]